MNIQDSIATLEIMIENVVLLTQKVIARDTCACEVNKGWSYEVYLTQEPQLFVWWKPRSQLIYISYERKRW
jgi:hypothetical protein